MVSKSFVFLYPQEEIFAYEIEKGSVFFKDPNENEKESYFMQMINNAKTENEKEKIREEARKDIVNTYRPVYAKKLNSCIDWRYRKNNFQIYYAILDDGSVSDIIEQRESDIIIKVGIDSFSHREKNKDGDYNYPNPDFILNQIRSPEKLVIAGFHMWDCVEKLAQTSYNRGINTLVDEDLTEFFAGRLNDRDFRIKKYPNYNARKLKGKMFDIFIAARKHKPWLWQDY